MSKDKQKPEYKVKYDYNKVKRHKLYAFARMFLLKPYTTLICRVKYVGLENVPKDKGFIVAANHTSFNDPLFLAGITRKPIHYMAKEEIFANPIFSWVLINLNSFPVQRAATSRASVQYGMKVVQQGEIMGIFPEGTRSRETYKPLRPKAGIALIAKQTGADVLPVSIYCEGRIKPYKKCTVRVGKMIPHEELNLVEGKPSELKYASKLIFDRIVALWEEGHCK